MPGAQREVGPGKFRLEPRVPARPLRIGRSEADPAGRDVEKATPEGQPWSLRPEEAPRRNIPGVGVKQRDLEDPEREALGGRPEPFHGPSGADAAVDGMMNTTEAGSMQKPAYDFTRCDECGAPLEHEDRLWGQCPACQNPRLVQNGMEHPERAR